MLNMNMQSEKKFHKYILRFSDRS